MENTGLEIYRDLATSEMEREVDHFCCLYLISRADIIDLVNAMSDDQDRMTEDLARRNRL